MVSFTLAIPAGFKLPMLLHRFRIKLTHLFVDLAHGVILGDMRPRSGGHRGEQRAVTVNPLQKICQRWKSAAWDSARSR